jgi:hypothetical protein
VGNASFPDSTAAGAIPGLFRLWIVGSVLFVIAVAVISYSEIKAQFDAVAPPPPPQGFEIVVSQL